MADRRISLKIELVLSALDSLSRGLDPKRAIFGPTKEDIVANVIGGACSLSIASMFCAADMPEGTVHNTCTEIIVPNHVDSI